MAHRKLRLMISSRCKTMFPLGDAAGVELSDIRKLLHGFFKPYRLLHLALPLVRCRPSWTTAPRALGPSARWCDLA